MKEKHQDAVSAPPPQPRQTDLDEKVEDKPPDGGYGWVCVACTAVINANSWGVNSSYGVFLSYYLENDIFPNTSPVAYAFIGGLSMCSCLTICPLVTDLIHRWGHRAILNIGVFLQTASFIFASFAKTKYQIVLSQGVCFGLGMGFIFTSSVSIIPQWFSKKRGIANAIAAAGSGVGGMTYSLASGVMIPRLGLAWTFRILGLCTFTANLVAVNLLKDRNKAVGSRYRAFHTPLLRRPEFLLLLAWGAFSLLGYVAILYSMVNFAVSIGLSSHQGSIAGALFNLGQTIGRPLVGLGSDHFGRLNAAIAGTIWSGVLCLILWIPASNAGVLYFFAIIGGTVAGTFWATIAPVCAEVVGMQDLPGGLSLTWVIMVIPTVVSEPIALLLRNESKGRWSYLNAETFSGVLYIAAGLTLLLVRGWKLGDNERIVQRQALAASNLDPLAVATRDGDDDDDAEPVSDSVEVSGKQPLPDVVRKTPVSCDPIYTSLWSPLHLSRRMFTWTRV